jgi:hypothetical protein
LNIDKALGTISKSRPRIIILHSTETDARAVLVRARALHMIGSYDGVYSGYQWVIQHMIDYMAFKALFSRLITR